MFLVASFYQYMINQSEINQIMHDWAILGKQIFLKTRIHLLFKVVLLLHRNTEIIVCFPPSETMHFI